jgi:transposase-like protein
MRGRRPIGPELTERLEGSASARRRMRVILETLAGTTRVAEACEQLGICPQRFEAIRAEAVRAGIAALEPRPAGRPTRAAERPPEIARLEARVEQLEEELAAARVRAELAGVLPPRRGRVAGKTRPRSGRAKESRRPRPGNPKATN